MADDMDAIVLVTLRGIQIVVTIYAIWCVWRWREERNHAASMLLPLLAVLLGLSVANLGHAGRLASEPDLIWWAWTMFDILLPLALIKLARGNSAAVSPGRGQEPLR